MVLKIGLDYMNGPIWKDTFDVEKGEMCTGIDIIDANEEINLLNDSIQDIYNSLYEFDVNEKAVIFVIGDFKSYDTHMISFLSLDCVV